ncbi:LysE family translocator [Marinitenerispora sediminis]|uniref:RhtB family transporter n=1 Tax=Marinitenerispora sediminis TaxID=1931232 RepID=A0A368SXQ7_9ACTN|nr:LysE family translocator [Marinitenerispora sediminis]RCV47358.1 RhtB family transporter [Marinitenerispora sediminis]RCV47418.1 RhtB family transporter [Marinitenerispora sediminis]RCV47804.1 RhtB family transporter [Marinitenerispora sediminis]
MFDTHTLAIFIAAGAALVIAPGPNLIYILTRSVSQGRRAGVISSLGVETGTLVHITATAVGLSSLLAASELAFNVVKYVGAGYLVYLGIRALRDGDQLSLTPSSATPPRALPRVYRDGILVSIFNPKVALFFMAFLPQFVDPAQGSVVAQVVQLGGIMAVMGLAMDLVYALGGGAIGGWLARRPALASRQHYLVGGVYLSLGAATALSGRH